MSPFGDYEEEVPSRRGSANPERVKIDRFSGCLRSPATGFILPSDQALVQNAGRNGRYKAGAVARVLVKKPCLQEGLSD